MKKQTIKETLGQVRDLLAKSTKEVISQEQYNNIVNNLYLFEERIDMCLLMAATLNDVAIPTCTEIYKKEADFEFPMLEDNKTIDTEIVYNNIEEITEGILEEVYGKDEVPTENHKLHNQKKQNYIDIQELYYIKENLKSIKENNNLIEDDKEDLNNSIDKVGYMLNKFKAKGKKCPHCDKTSYLSDLPQYDYVCLDCDENFYECEV